MGFPNFLKKFFSNEYTDFELSQLEFRKKMLKIFQHSLNFFLVIEMIILYSRMSSNIYYYAFVPTLLVSNNICIWIFCRANKYKWCPWYYFILQIIVQAAAIELSLTKAESVSKDKTFLMGIQLGLIHLIGSLNLFSSILKFSSSIIFFFHLTLRLTEHELDTLYLSLIIILILLFVTSFVYYRFEMLNFSIWSSYMKSNLGLLHFQKLIDLFPNQILVINKISVDEDKPIYFNQEAEKLREELLVGNNKSFTAFLELFWIEDKYFDSFMGQEYPLHRITLKTFVQNKFEIAHSVGDFKKIISELNGFRWELEYGWIEWNKEAALILIFSDVSKSEKILELETLDKNKDRILATVSHELRTPLNAVVGMIDVSIEEIPENLAPIKNYLRVAKESASTLSHMINNILDIELIRKGKLHLNFKIIRLTEILEKVLPIAEIMARRKNLELIFRNDCPCNTLLHVDPIRFQQILMNLLENACKFTLEGFIKLTIKQIQHQDVSVVNIIGRRKSLNNVLHFNNTLLEKEMFLNTIYSNENDDDDDDYIKEEDEEHLIKISIEDSGIGITEEKKKCLFKLFGKEETNLSVKGLGLGLAITQSLALKMGSSGIQLKREKEKGSKFFFTIKAFMKGSFFLEDIPDEVDHPTTLRDFPLNSIRDFHSCPSFHNDPLYKILVVDDDHVNHLVISFYLKSLSDVVKIDKVYDGRQALDLVFKKANEKYYFDLVLMDCDMPVMNGLEATTELKNAAINGLIPNMKIIALTANASISNRECCINLGMLDVWNKPISKSVFISKLKEHLPNELKERLPQQPE